MQLAEASLPLQELGFSEYEASLLSHIRPEALPAYTAYKHQTRRLLQVRRLKCWPAHRRTAHLTMERAGNGRVSLSPHRLPGCRCSVSLFLAER